VPAAARPVRGQGDRDRGAVPGALFCKVHHSGAVDGQRRPLSPFGMEHVLQRHLARAGVTPFTLHDFRRSLASDLLDAGADISAVQQQLGHANVQTTLRYDRRHWSACVRPSRSFPHPSKQAGHKERPRVPRASLMPPWHVQAPGPCYLLTAV
jgi:Phage integrase family